MPRRKPDRNIAKVSDGNPRAHIEPKVGMHAPTLRDIAERVGVSQATVSAILNDAPNVEAFAQRTRKEVREAAEALGYKINPLAQALRRRRSGVIGCVLFNQHDIYYGQVAEVVDQYAKERGYQTAVASMGYDFSRFDACMAQMAAWRVEGLLIMLGGRSLPGPQSAMLGHLNVPCLIGDAEQEDGSSSVALFSYKSGRIAAQHLLELGHRQFCVVGCNKSNLHSSERLRGVQEVLCEKGVELPAKMMVATPKSLHGPHAGRVCTELVLEAQLKFTALVALNDLLAMGALSVLRERGIDVPKSCSIIGFDDLALDASASEVNRLGNFLSPPLTTVRLPMQDFCREATRRLLSRVIQSESESSYVIELQPRLIVRASTASARQT